MLQEPDEVAMKRRRTRETLRVLQQAIQVSFLIHNLYGCMNLLQLLHLAPIHLAVGFKLRIDPCPLYMCVP